MIVAMKKYVFLVYHAEYLKFLNELQELGVVHVNEKERDENDAEGYGLREKQTMLQKLKNVHSILHDRVSGAPGKKEGDLETIVQHVEENVQKLDNLNQQISVLTKQKGMLEPWGQFEWEKIQKLQEQDIHLSFFVTSQKLFQESWLQQHNIEIIDTIGSTVYFVAIHAPGQIPELNAELVKLPETSLAEIDKSLETTNSQIVETGNRLNDMAQNYLALLEEGISNLNAKIQFDQVVLSTQKTAEEKLMVLEGWIPVTKEEKILEFLDKREMVYLEQDIMPEDKIPVLLRNNKFARLFEPIGELFSLPSYKEMDLTPFFAPFYMLFFGFCLGDAGYGLLMVIASLVMRPKVSKKIKPVLSLVFFLGISTIIFGLIGGTFFGINLYDTGLPVYAGLQERFQQKDTDINEYLFNLSLLIGAIQILFGMVLKAINEMTQLGIKYALSTFGWIFLFVGLALQQYLKRTGSLPQENLDIMLYIVIGIAGIFVFLLNSPGKNIFLNIGLGVWNAYNMATGLLGDLLSYIRLFALGISSAILGFVFNSLAVSMSPDVPVLNIIVMAIILIIGHGINIFMSGLGSFVHPMRLTFVEFYKNAGFAGGGKKYNPFGTFKN
jgi:V/A-type H+/Na+-transporting ATPase subunit I